MGLNIYEKPNTIYCHIRTWAKSMRKTEYIGGCYAEGRALCSKAFNIYREILHEVQDYCPIGAVYAEILQEMQQIKR